MSMGLRAESGDQYISLATSSGADCVLEPKDNASASYEWVYC